MSRHNPAELQAKCQSLTLAAASWINNGYCPCPHFKSRINLFAENVSRHNPAELQAKCQSLTLPAASWIKYGYCPRPHFKPRIATQLNCRPSVSPSHCRQPAGSIMAIVLALILSQASVIDTVVNFMKNLSGILFR